MRDISNLVRRESTDQNSAGMRRHFGSNQGGKKERTM